jgi:hypothetical protein
MPTRVLTLTAIRDALKDKGIKPCIRGRKKRGKPITHDKCR